MLSSQINEEVVLLDSKFLKVCDNPVTNKKTWWASAKKIYVVNLDEYEVILYYFKKNFNIITFMFFYGKKKIKL